MTTEDYFSCLSKKRYAMNHTRNAPHLRDQEFTSDPLDPAMSKTNSAWRGWQYKAGRLED